MANDRLLLRREPDKSFTLLGRVMREEGSDVTIRTVAGEEATLSRRGLLFVNVGSIPHFLNLHPGLLTEVFEQEPRAVVEQVLVDAKTPLSTVQLKEKLIQSGISSESLEARWADLKKALVKSADVKTLKQGQTKYEWKASREARLKRFLPLEINSRDEREAQPPQGGATPMTLDEDRHRKDRSERTDGEPRLPPGINDEPEATAGPDGPEDRQTPPDIGDLSPAPAPRHPLLDALASVLGKVAPPTVEQVAGSTLRLGAALSEVPDKELRVLTRLDGEAQDLARLLLAAREREPAAWRSSDVSFEAQTVESAFASVIAEAARAREEDAPGTNKTLQRFLARVLSRTKAEDLPLPLVVQAFIRVSSADQGDVPSKRTMQVAEVLAAKAGASFTREWDSVAAAIPDLARHSRRLPLDSSGARARLLSGVYAIRRDIIVQRAFWRDASLAELIEAAQGALRTALSDPTLADQVLAPLIAERLETLTTRSALSEVLALPSAFTRFVAPEKLRAAMQRVSGNDPVFGTWYDVISQASALSTAKTRAEEALAAADTEKLRAQAASEQLEQVQSALDAANALIQEGRKANEQARDAGNRQAKVDVLRSLASLALAFKESRSAKDDPALLQRVDFTLRREGLMPISASGESVGYDPALHDALGAHVEPGSTVIVLRPGYTYATGRKRSPW